MLAALRLLTNPLSLTTHVRDGVSCIRRHDKNRPALSKDNTVKNFQWSIALASSFES